MQLKSCTVVLEDVLGRCQPPGVHAIKARMDINTEGRNLIHLLPNELLGIILSNLGTPELKSFCYLSKSCWQTARTALWAAPELCRPISVLNVYRYVKRAQRCKKRHRVCIANVLSELTQLAQLKVPIRKLKVSQLKMSHLTTSDEIEQIIEFLRDNFAIQSIFVDRPITDPCYPQFPLDALALFCNKLPVTLLDTDSLNITVPPSEFISYMIAKGLSNSVSLRICKEFHRKCTLRDWRLLAGNFRITEVEIFEGGYIWRKDENLIKEREELAELDRLLASIVPPPTVDILGSVQPRTLALLKRTKINSLHVNTYYVAIGDVADALTHMDHAPDTISVWFQFGCDRRFRTGNVFQTEVEQLHLLAGSKLDITIQLGHCWGDSWAQQFAHAKETHPELCKSIVQCKLISSRHAIYC